jgi:hypothetical protein
VIREGLLLRKVVLHHKDTKENTPVCRSTLVRRHKDTNKVFFNTFRVLVPSFVSLVFKK